MVRLIVRTGQVRTYRLGGMDSSGPYSPARPVRFVRIGLYSCTSLAWPDCMHGPVRTSYYSAPLKPSGLYRSGQVRAVRGS